MSESVKVLPCPFCGIGPIRLDRVFKPSGTYGEMICLECGATGPQSPYDEAVSRWNNRFMAVNDRIIPPSWAAR